MEKRDVRIKEMLKSSIMLLREVFDSFINSCGEKNCIIFFENTDDMNEAEYWKYAITLKSIYYDEDFVLNVAIKKGENHSFLFFQILLNVCNESLKEFCMEFDKENVLSYYVEEIRKRVIEAFENYVKNNYYVDLKLITAISAAYYESEPAKGDIIFFLQELTKNILEIGEEGKVVFGSQSIRKFRKNLEITSAAEAETSEVHMVCTYDGKWRFVGFTDSKVEGQHIRFHFDGHMIWEMRKNGKLVVTYNCANYWLPNCYQKMEFQHKINELKANIDCLNEKLWECVETARRQKHGTIIVIILGSENAKEESKRLCKESSGISLDGKALPKNYILGMTAVDGAMIIDELGNVYGYAMILDSDNELNFKQDNGRGARFNSAKRYIVSRHAKGLKAMAMIVSEDGMVNMFSTVDAEKEK